VNKGVTKQHGAVSGTYLFTAAWSVRFRRITRQMFYFNDFMLQVLKYMQITTVNNKMCQTGSRECVAGGTDIDQLHYLNAECPFWVFNIYFYGP